MDTQSNLELAERVQLIESMLAEGRRKCESWGWTFVLWGVAYYIAYFWSTRGQFAYAWPVTVIAASLVTAAGFMRKDSGPITTMGRAIASIWLATGLSMFILFQALSYANHLGFRTFVCTASAMLGLANAACGLTLKWKAEFACGVVWWAAAVAASFGSADVAGDAFLAAIFLCQIVFGIYAMILESRRRRPNGAAHA